MRKRPSRFVFCLSLSIATILSGLVLFTTIFEIWLADSWVWLQSMVRATFP